MGTHHHLGRIRVAFVIATLAAALLDRISRRGGHTVDRVRLPGRLLGVG